MIIILPDTIHRGLVIPPVWQNKFYKEKRDMKKKLLRVLLTLVMIIGLLPTTAFTAEIFYDI